MNTSTTAVSTNAILAIDLGKYKSVAGCNPVSVRLRIGRASVAAWAQRAGARNVHVALTPRRSPCLGAANGY